MAISLQEVLELRGLTKWMEFRYTREFVQRHLEEGAIRRIQGRGLR